MDMNTILALRMERMHTAAPAGREEYDGLFRDLSPVQTAGWVEPGTPPALPGHVGFDDAAFNGWRRGSREIRKGRFGGRLAYVDRRDWELFACLYQKPIRSFTPAQAEMLELLEREGPLNIGLIKETTGLLVKAITPILHRLQEAFLVYEDQVTGEGDRGWYAMHSEFPDLDLQRYTKQQALEILLPRLCRRMVWMTAEAAQAFYAQPAQLVRKAIASLVASGLLHPWEFCGREGYLLPDDLVRLQNAAPTAPARQVLPLQRNDPLVRCLSSQEKAALSGGKEALYYLLIDGRIRGAVCGRFKFGPHLLEDVVVDLDLADAQSRREEIIDAVYTVFDRHASPLQKYCGQPVGDCRV